LPRLIYERALHVDEATGRITSYWPERWPLHLLAKELIGMGSAFFAAAYQNDPSALEGSLLKANWLHPYLGSELEAHRRSLGVEHGTIHCGIDPTQGGIDGDPDFCAGIAVEVLEHRGYLIDFFLKKLRIEDQAQYFEDWLTFQSPSFTIIEDTTSKGYVYNALAHQVNSGTGTKHAITIEKPQGRNAIGNKQVRFMSMAPRFENAQVRVPGLQVGSEIILDPRWEPWFTQWRSFPSGHDDGLDAAYWAIFSGFRIDPGASASKLPTGTDTPARVDSTNPKLVGILCEREAHLAFGKPISECIRCMLTLEDTFMYDEQTVGTPGRSGLVRTLDTRSIGQPRNRPNRIRMMR